MLMLIVSTVYNHDSHVAEYHFYNYNNRKNAARGSKYMQNKLRTVYKDALSWMKANPEKKLLFAGMGCRAEDL